MEKRPQDSNSARPTSGSDTNPFRNGFSPTITPPPIPPKPSKFQRNSIHSDGSPAVPPRPPLPTPTGSTEPEDSNNKRKLSLQLSLPSQIPMSSSSSTPSATTSSSTSSIVPNRSEGYTEDLPVCKSPKVITPGHTRIWSPVICTICMEDLFSYPECDPKLQASSGLFHWGNSTKSQSEAEAKAKNLTLSSMSGPDTIRPIVSTRCGHLFHTECINKWFVEKKEKEIKECPFCKKEMMANDTTRIFPIFE